MNRRIRLGVVWLSFVLLASSLWASGVSERASASAEILRSHVAFLASDELEGRATWSEGIDKAADYIAQRFAEYGLQPGGDEGRYFQKWEKVIRREMTGDARLEISGLESPLVLQQDFVTMPFSTEQEFDGPLAFVGYGITNPQQQHDDYADFDAHGKVLLMLRYEPSVWKTGLNRSTPHAEFRTKAQLAKERGAVAILIVNSSSSSSDELYESGKSDQSFSWFGELGDFGLPMMHVKRAVAEKLLASAGLAPLDELQQRLDRNEFITADLKNLSAKGKPGIRAVTAPLQNVVGILPGEGPLANEYVVFGAHYDHLGKVPPNMIPRVDGKFDPKIAVIHNGADDNASGTAGVLELARIFASGPKLKRSLVFVAFTGEEVGLLGSRYFVDHPPIPVENVVAMINLDMIGRLQDKPLVAMGSRTGKEFEAYLKKHSETLGMEVQYRGPAGGGSDHSSFVSRDVPVLFFYTGMHPDYHRPTDDTDKIDFDGESKVVSLAQAVADEIIEAPSRPTWQKIESQPKDLRVRMGIVPVYAKTDDLPGWPTGGVLPGRAAERAGMKDGDRILSISGEEIKTIQDYIRILHPHAPGDEIVVVVLRGNEQLTLTIKLEGK